MSKLGPKLVTISRWAPGAAATGQATTVAGSALRPLLAIEAFEQLAALIAATSEPQREAARRLAPETDSEPVALLIAVRSARIFVGVPPDSKLTLECSVKGAPGELVVVAGEVHDPRERVAKVEVQYVLVPATGEHLREAQIRDAERKRLLGTS